MASQWRRAAGGGGRILGWVFLAVGLGLIAGSGVAAWREFAFRGIAVETDGRIVSMQASAGSSSGGRRASTSWTPVFAFKLPDGQVVQVVAGFSSSPPCCAVGDAVRVRYDPARPENAAMTGFMSSWFVATLLGGLGIVFGGIGALILGVAGRAAPAGAATMLLPLSGIRQEMSAGGPRWILQASWSDPASGAVRLVEGPPLPFDPVPQMRQMTHVAVAWDPMDPAAPPRMDLSFLVDPRQGPVRVVR